LNIKNGLSTAKTDSYKIYLSTDPMMNETTMNNQCNSLSLTLEKELAEDIQDKVC
jgi:hypothetical protein